MRALEHRRVQELVLIDHVEPHVDDLVIAAPTLSLILLDWNLHRQILTISSLIFVDSFLFEQLPRLVEGIGDPEAAHPVYDHRPHVLIVAPVANAPLEHKGAEVGKCCDHANIEAHRKSLRPQQVNEPSKLDNGHDDQDYEEVKMHLVTPQFLMILP